MRYAVGAVIPHHGTPLAVDDDFKLHGKRFDIIA